MFYLDVYTSTVLRGDLHQSYFSNPSSNDECLHNHHSHPNPMDHWNRRLLNLLRVVGELLG